jgi:transposase
VARNRRKFSPEFKEEAAKMAVDTSESIAHVARELNVNETTLGNWVKEYREKHAGAGRARDTPVSRPDRDLL